MLYLTINITALDLPPPHYSLLPVFSVPQGWSLTRSTESSAPSPAETPPSSTWLSLVRSVWPVCLLVRIPLASPITYPNIPSSLGQKHDYVNLSYNLSPYHIHELRLRARSDHDVLGDRRMDPAMIHEHDEAVTIERVTCPSGCRRSAPSCAASSPARA